MIFCDHIVVLVLDLSGQSIVTMKLLLYCYEAMLAENKINY
jgi:hypothetical protein